MVGFKPMATPSQILFALRNLTAYYGKEPTKEQARFYLEMLAELEPAALEHAVQAWIRRSPFFPRISELLQTAANYRPPPIDPVRALYQMQYRLEQKFILEGVLDLNFWENLAQRFEANDRSYSASACRKRLGHYQEMLAQENEPEIWAESIARNREKWQQQSAQLINYQATGELPEQWK
jgi:hypothetical protein